mmetsp:Transcript_43480/g.100090  ORF Transcript_43480/g.100090 Transcript_43480/m.100090 type:complete len:155 (-) Transcript_43480:62-526(-)
MDLMQWFQWLLLLGVANSALLASAGSAARNPLRPQRISIAEQAKARQQERRKHAPLAVVTRRQEVAPPVANVYNEDDPSLAMDASLIALDGQSRRERLSSDWEDPEMEEHAPSEQEDASAATVQRHLGEFADNDDFMGAFAPMTAPTKLSRHRQ